nr:enoyl-CoA hydratase-related protein [Conexibacter arvalis]
MRTETEGTVATVWLARPPVNAVTQAMYREITALFSDVTALGDDVRAIVLAGEGRHFCGGNDLHEFETLSPENAEERMRTVREAFFAIQDCELPVVGAVQGTAVGTGLAIAASCDFVVAAEDAQLGVPEISVGVMGAARHLARLLPQPIVRAMFLSGQPRPAAELARYGAVVEVVAREQLLDAARERAREIARHSPLAIRYAKRALNAIEHMELQEGYCFEQGLTGELSGSRDAKEAVRAFFEGREPEYVGT